MSSPLAQFEIHAIAPLQVAGVNVPFTNSSLFMLLAALAATAFIVLGMRRQAIIPGRFQSAVEILHDAIANMVEQSAGEKSKPFFPFIFSLFLFILFGNLLGMFPHTFTITSHLLVTFLLAFMVFLMVTVTGFVRHGFHFFHLFVPSGVPLALAPFLMVIELLSFCVRPISLSIRLFANMMAGHILLKIFAGMTVSLITALGVGGFLLGLVPLAMNIFVTGFEFFVAALQAYIFAILASVYLRDALEMH
jgi:F-type H+-transporting ATPase subunit a